MTCIHLLFIKNSVYYSLVTNRAAREPLMRKATMALVATLLLATSLSACTQEALKGALTGETKFEEFGSPIMKIPHLPQVPQPAQ